MKKAVRALTLGLIAVLSLSLTGCGLETLTGSRKVVTSTGDVNELQDDRAYVWHNEKAEDIRKDLKKPSKKDIFFLCPTGDINFKKEELSEVSEHPRSIWIGKEDDKQIPTLTSGDRLLYVAQEMPEQIVFERFADYGYTIGVSNLIDDGGGHYYIEYAGADKDTYKYSIDMESDAAALAGFENLSHLYLDQAGDVKVTEDTVSDGGTVTDLEKGKTYKLKFKAKSSLDRQIRVVMQGQENRGWSVYSSDNIVDLTNEYQTFEDTFTMNEDTDTAAFFSACLGKIGDNQITTQHEVRIDDISLEEVKDDPKDDIKDNPKDDPKEDINTDIKNEQPKVPAPVIKTSDSDKAKTTQAVKESKTAKAAKTGDNSPILAYVFGAMAGALILAVSFLKKRKNTTFHAANHDVSFLCFSRRTC